MQETQVPSLGQDDPLEKETQPTPVSLPGNPMDRGARQAAVHGATEESDKTERPNNHRTGHSSCVSGLLQRTWKASSLLLFLASLGSTRGLSFWTSDRTCTRRILSAVVTTGPQGSPTYEALNLISPHLWKSSADPGWRATSPLAP